MKPRLVTLVIGLMMLYIGVDLARADDQWSRFNSILNTKSNPCEYIERTLSQSTKYKQYLSKHGIVNLDEHNLRAKAYDMVLCDTEAYINYAGTLTLPMTLGIFNNNGRINGAFYLRQHPYWLIAHAPLCEVIIEEANPKSNATVLKVNMLYPYDDYLDYNNDGLICSSRLQYRI